MWKKSPKADGIASISLEQMANGAKTRFHRWKVHGDWVQKVHLSISSFHLMNNNNMMIYVAPYKIQGFFDEQKCALDGLQVTLEERRRFGKTMICGEPSFTVTIFRF